MEKKNTVHSPNCIACGKDTQGSFNIYPDGLVCVDCNSKPNPGANSQIIKNLKTLRSGIFKDEDAVNRLIDETIKLAEESKPVAEVMNPELKDKIIHWEIQIHYLLSDWNAVKNAGELYGENLDAQEAYIRANGEAREKVLEWLNAKAVKS